MTTMAVNASLIGYQNSWSSILCSSFMRQAMIGGTIAACAAGLLGYFVVLRGSTFAAHAIAHIGLPGATGAVLVGLPPAAGLGIFCVGGAVAIGALGQRVGTRDVVTGTVLAFATGLGLLFTSLARKNASTMTNVLFGNLLAITDAQLAIFATSTAALAITIGFLYRPLLYCSVNPAVARARGVPIRALSGAFMVLLGVAVTMAVQVVGTLLLFALLVAPAATAMTVTARPARAIGCATVLSVGSVWSGLVASAVFNLPPSFPIVAVSCGIWLCVWLVDRRKGGNQW